MDLLVDRQDETERIELGDGRSWVDFVSGFLPAAATQFEAMYVQTVSQQAGVLRYDRYGRQLSDRPPQRGYRRKPS